MLETLQFTMYYKVYIYFKFKKLLANISYKKVLAWHHIFEKSFCFVYLLTFDIFLIVYKIFTTLCENHFKQTLWLAASLLSSSSNCFNSDLNCFKRPSRAVKCWGASLLLRFLLGASSFMQWSILSCVEFLRLIQSLKYCDW